MGFQPSKSHPVKVALAGTTVSMSISSAETHAATVRALIAEAKLDEAREYLDYRLALHAEDMGELRKCLEEAQRPVPRKSRRRR